MNNLNSPVEKINLNGFELFVKRDDLLCFDFSGNKARKFYYFLKRNFKDVKKIISYGSAQANALYSLSVLAKRRNWQLDFYVNHISAYLLDNPEGNYLEALKNGANIKIKEDKKATIHDYVQTEVLPFESNYLFIEEGGRVQEAQEGIALLAWEIQTWAEENKLGDIEVMLPSGTGTTALYLQKYLPFKVLTCPCVGDANYLKAQFKHLEPYAKKYPTILQPSKKYHFGKLYEEFYAMYKTLKEQTHIEFELLYDPLGFITLLDYMKQHPQKTMVYIHQGGVLGNSSMLKRYERKKRF